MSEHARATATATATELSGPATRRTPLAFVGGAVIGALGGLIGLGGAEFRLPLLIGAFRFAALQAVILNKAMSLVVVASALPFRASGARSRHWPRIGRSSSTYCAGVCSALGSGPGGRRGWPRNRSIASSLFCWSVLPACCCSVTTWQHRGPC